MGGQQPDQALLAADRMRHKDEARAEIRLTLSRADQPVQVNDRDDAAAVDENTGEPGRGALDPLQLDEGDHLVNPPDVQCQTRSLPEV